MSLHLPLNDNTRAIIKRNCVEALPQGGILINTARGALIDQLCIAVTKAIKNSIPGCFIESNEFREIKPWIQQYKPEIILGLND